jgi:predicted permease
MKAFLRKLGWIAQRRRKEEELREELAFHLAEESDERKADGLSEQEARFAARRELGSVALIAEDTRSSWGWIWIERVGQDVRYALRMMRRKPGFALAAILTLMLGIGGNTAMFSLMNALLMKSLPVDRPEELVRLIEQGRDPSVSFDNFTLVTYDTLQRQTRTLSGVLASSVSGARPVEIEERGEKVPVFLQSVSDNYFDVLGIRAFRGRTFTQPDAGSPREAIAVISHDYWRRHYASNLSALGARFRLHEGPEFTIAGVAPPGFGGTELDVPAEIWVSFEHTVPPGDADRVRGRWMRVMGRPQPGATMERAEAEATAILGRTVRFQPAANGYSTLRRRLMQPLLLLAIVFGLVLLITCANLANLMLAATVARERELGVRTAVGASRARIVRQLLTECLLLALAGGALALVAAHWISAALLSFLPPDQAPALANLRFKPELRVLGFAAVVSCVTCLVFGLIPALRATRKDAVPQFRAGAGTGERNRNWLSRGLLVSQVVMCTALLVLAGVMLRSLQNLRGQDTGYRDEDHILVADVQPSRDYSEQRGDELIEELRARVAALPGVETAAFGHAGQLTGGAFRVSIGFSGRPSLATEKTLVIEQRVSPGYLRAMGTQLVAGRDVMPADDARAPLVAVVNESFAHRFGRGGDPIGEHFFREEGSLAGKPIEIIGVVRDSKWSNLRDDPPAMYYIPYRQMGGIPVVRFVIRTSRHPNAVAPLVLQAAQSIDRRLAVSNLVPFREIVNRSLLIERLIAHVSAAFAALALLTAAVGLYGVLAYTVVRRRREIGVRIAIGARPRAVEWMIIRESLVLLACGVAIGIPASMMITQLVSSLLFGLSPRDPGTLIAALSALTIATIAAAYVPAKRAASIDPILALREE